MPDVLAWVVRLLLIFVYRLCLAARLSRRVGGVPRAPGVSERLNLHGYLPIKADYGISVAAIIMRARDLGIIRPDRARSLQIRLSSQGWRTNEPVPVAQEKPVLLGQALRRVYGKQATAKAAHELGAAREWINQWTYADVEPPAPEPGKVIDFAARTHGRRAG